MIITVYISLPKTSLSFPGPSTTVSVARYWSPKACLPIQIGFFQPVMGKRVLNIALQNFIRIRDYDRTTYYQEQFWEHSCIGLVHGRRCLHKDNGPLNEEERANRSKLT